MKSKKKRLFIIGGLLFVVGMFILYKVSLWAIYNSCVSDIGDMEELMSGYKNYEDISISKKKVDDYLEFKWFDVGNFFKDFKHDPSASTEWNETYYQYDGDKKVGMLSVGTFNSLVGITSEDITIYGSADYNGLDFSSWFFTGIENFIEEKNIKDDADLIKEFAKYDFDKKKGVFTSFNKLREDYSIRLLASIALPSVDKVYYIYGEHKGYMLELINEEKGNKLYEINLFKNEKRYILSVLSKDINLDMMKEVIGTIELK